MGAGAVGWSYGGAFCLQICAVQKQGGFRGDGALRLHGQRRGRDAQAQHGAGSAPDVPEHHHLAQEQD